MLEVQSLSVHGMMITQKEVVSMVFNCVLKCWNEPNGVDSSNKTNPRHEIHAKLVFLYTTAMRFFVAFYVQQDCCVQTKQVANDCRNQLPDFDETKIMQSSC